MRIATWNVNGLRARLAFVLLWLAERRPDLVALQETKSEDERFPRAELEAAGYRVAYHGQKGWNGVAVLAREPMSVATAGLPGQEALGARLLTAEASGVTLTSLYCPNGKSVAHDDYPAKLAWLDALAVHVGPAATSQRPVVLGGDFNLCPTPLDTWDEPALAGSIFHTDAERARFRTLTELGWVDLFRRCRPEERAYSWWDYRAGAFHRGQGLRIDFLLGNPEAARRVRDVRIDREWRKKKDGLTPSDHAPVWADL